MPTEPFFTKLPPSGAKPYAGVVDGIGSRETGIF